MAGPASATPETPPPAGDGHASVAVSPELFAPVSTGVELCYRTYGDPAGEPMLLLMGLASPLNWWDPRALLDARPARLLRDHLRQP
jgi:hypothetical protein